MWGGAPPLTQWSPADLRTARYPTRNERPQREHSKTPPMRLNGPYCVRQ